MIQAFHRVRRDRAELVQPAGTGMPGAQVLVLTPSGAPCGPGEVGRVHIRTPYAAHGNLGHDQPAFIGNPLRPGDPDDRVFRTEDRARVLPDGAIEVLGRDSDGTSIDGVRIEPERVNALLARESGVRASAVLRGTGNRGLIAFVVPTSPSTDIDGIRRALQRKLPTAAVPAHFVPVPDLPVTAVGKLDRDHLRKGIGKK
jgi:acyl-coenzyme A synthetase/AMP-(fatty) acid ligase